MLQLIVARWQDVRVFLDDSVQRACVWEEVIHGSTTCKSNLISINRGLEK